MKYKQQSRIIILTLLILHHISRFLPLTTTLFSAILQWLSGGGIIALKLWGIF